MDFEFKVPTSQEEMDALRKTLVEEIDDDALDNVAGGNDDLKAKLGKATWACPLCGTLVECKSSQDPAKHMTKCPANPYKK